MLLAANSALSIVSIVAVLQSFIHPMWRDLVQNGIEALWNRLCRRLYPYTSVQVYEDSGETYTTNHFYNEVERYLGSLQSWTNGTDNVIVQRSSDASDFLFRVPPEETVEDIFKGAQMLWTHHVTPTPKGDGEKSSFSLKLLKTDRAGLLREYFEHISKISTEIVRRNSQRKLYTNEDFEWAEVDFKHPSTFDTLALPPELKERIEFDLKTFKESENFYHSVGRVWKRGYLLYGPPGTGKSSMIVAMANFLDYDIYDLELTRVRDNSSLKSFLMRTTRKAIIVIEDIDCSLDLWDRATKWSSEKQTKAAKMMEYDPFNPPSKVTLSGLLNFTDGLWSCCGEERIFVFTTNHKDRLDPALLRSGRMDFHILLSYCTFAAFKVLAVNYLGLQEHDLYNDLEEAMKNNSTMTPADVVEVLISNKQNPEAALRNIVSALKQLPTPDDQSRDHSSTHDQSHRKSALQKQLRSLRKHAPL